MTNLMHGTMMTQRMVMVGAKSGLHFKSMPKYYLQKIRFTRKSCHNKITFFIFRGILPLENKQLQKTMRLYTQALQLGKKLLQII